jgi:LmbE family N-acetylglucosaminyl deacetylase
MRRRPVFGYVIISPHQDDEYLGCGQMLKTMIGTKVVVMVTQSLWPANSRYGIRQLESSHFARSCGAEVRYLGLKEEDLFNPPYDPLNYIGAPMEAAWAAELKALLELLQNQKDALYIFYPSAPDAAGHVVHNFTRNIALSALSAMSGDIRTYEYSIYAEPVTARPMRCDFNSKFVGFKITYPTQWEEIKNNVWASNQVRIHSAHEWYEKT